MSNKKSSVEWLKDQLEHFGNKHELTVSWTTIDELFEQAKAMHKYEIKKVWFNGYTAIDAKNVETYYNEMYGGNNGTK